MTLRVKYHRNKKGWTLEQLSAVSGLSRGFLSQIENGHRKAGAETLEILSAAFGCPVADLYETAVGDDPTLNMIVNGVQNLTPQNRQIVFDLISALAQKQVEQ